MSENTVIIVMMKSMQVLKKQNYSIEEKTKLATGFLLNVKKIK